MTLPTITTYIGQPPAKEQSNPVLDTNIDYLLDYTKNNYVPELQAFIIWAEGVRDNVLATALAGDLPALTGKAGQFMRANVAEDGAEFTADVAPLAGPSFTGIPAAPTADYETDTTQIATTAFVQANKSEVIIATTTISAAASSVDFTFDESLYRAVRLELSNLSPATDGVNLLLRTSTDDGSSYDDGASAYDYANTGVASLNTNHRGTASEGDSAVLLNLLTIGNGSTESVSGQITIFDPSEAKETRLIGQLVYRYFSSTNWLTGLTSYSSRKAEADVNGIRLFFSSGNISSGTIRMIGVLK